MDTSRFITFEHPYEKDFQLYNTQFHRYNHCKAWYSDPVYFPSIGAVIFIMSYDSIVAILYLKNKELWRLGHFSTTTSRHINSIMGALIMKYPSLWDTDEVETDGVPGEYELEMLLKGIE